MTCARRKEKKRRRRGEAPEVTTKQQTGTAPQVLAYRHPGRRSDSETDEDRNRPHRGKG